MKLLFAVGILSTGVIGTLSAAGQSWAKAEKADPLHGTQFLQYSLEGRYLTPPRNAAADAAPVIVVRCIPGSHKSGWGHVYGKFLEGYIFVGGVVDTHVSAQATTKATVEFRLDDGKLQEVSWNHSTDFSSLFFGDIDFDNLLYGHLLRHKESKGQQVRKVVLGVPEFLGGEVVMQFAMPEATAVADACGVILH